MYVNFRDNFGDRSTNCHFLHRLYVSHRTISSIELLDVLYETKVYICILLIFLTPIPINMLVHGIASSSGQPRLEGKVGVE